MKALSSERGMVAPANLRHPLTKRHRCFTKTKSMSQARGRVNDSVFGHSFRPLLEVVLHEGVNAVVSSCPLSFPPGRPEKVVESYLHIAAQPPTVVEIPRSVFRAPANGHIGIAGVVKGVTEGDAVAGRKLIAQFQPTAFTADFRTGASIDTLPDAPAKITQVPSCPKFSA